MDKYPNMDVKRLYTGNQTGGSKLSAIIWILVLALIVYGSVKIVPVYIINYQIQNLFEVNADRAETTPLQDIKSDVAAKLQTMHAPVTIDDVTITQNDPKSLTIRAQYSVTVKFVDDFKITFHFNPEAKTEVE